MIIGVDGNEANVARKVGISEYAYQLLTGFSKLASKNHKFVIYLKDKPRPEMPSESEFLTYKVLGPKKLWTQFALPLRLLITRVKPDVFFTPSHYSPRFARIPTVISLMDVSYLHFPQMFAKKDLYQLTNWTEYSVKMAKKVITISKSSKNDILTKYNLSDNRVVVTYPGIKSSVSLTPTIYDMKHLQDTYGISGQYFLFVGTLQPRKNIVRLIEAFSILIKEEPKKDVQLLIVGKKGWQYEEILDAPKKYDVEEHVKFLDFVTDDELSVLYEHAVAYVLPSLYEGFGLPVLEAFEHDCPVITSNISSLPEAAGDAALLVDPEDTKAIARAMETLLTGPKLRKELIEKGRIQRKKFDWDKTAKETLTILTEVVDKK